MNRNKIFGLSLSFVLGYAALVQANPDSPTITYGDATIGSVGDTLTVEASTNRTIIEWESFSIGSAETTVFTLPSSSGAVLNRVTGSSISEIDGIINSNGQVFVINENGYLFGSSSAVNTQTFVAATLDCADYDFINATDMTYTGAENTDVYLIHNGTITADGGDIVLMSYQVETHGDLIAEDGSIATGAGVEIVYQPYGDDKIAIVTHSTLSPASLGVYDNGNSTSPSIEIRADGNLYSLAISHEGLAEAIGSGNGAYVRFVAVDGAVATNGSVIAEDSGIGGRIDVTGVDVNIGSSTILDASADAGQGQIYIGGGWDGDDPSVLNATTTYVDASSILDVSALDSGKGGTVVVWSDDTTTCYGTIVAVGGPTTGDGGDVQVGAGTGGCYTVAEQNIDVSSPTGDPGVIDLQGDECTLEGKMTRCSN